LSAEPFTSNAPDFPFLWRAIGIGLYDSEPAFGIGVLEGIGSNQMAFPACLRFALCAAFPR
jgi:hypothetical protein